MRATYQDVLQDVLDAPDHVVAEVLDGALVVTPRPGPAHAMASVVFTTSSAAPS